MSYDLYLLPSRTFSLADFEAYFRGRAHYSLNNRQAFYENEDTGVNFSFEYEDRPPDDPEEATPRPHVSFNLNYFRPHVFGLEAAPEINAVVAAFSCAVEDPQIEGIRGGYSHEAFLHAWNAGNFLGYSAILENGAAASLADCVVAKSDLIRESWRWNRQRSALSAHLNAQQDEVFVPRIVWGREKATSAPVRLAVWSAGVPTIMPAAISHILVALAPKHSAGERLRAVFSAPKPAPIDRFLIRWDELREILGKTADHEGEGYVRFDYGPERLPRSKLIAIGESRGEKTFADNPVEIVAWDHVLDADLVERAIGHRS